MNLDPEPSSSDSSETSSLDSREKKKKNTKKKKRRKHRKYDLSDPSSSDDYDSSADSHYRRKRRKNKKYRKKDPIKLCATLTVKLLTTAYKSKTIRFKMDEDPLERRIYFLTFIDSFDMIFSHYRETCEVLLDYPKLGGDAVIEDYAKKAIRNLLYANIAFDDKSIYARTLQQVTHKGGESEINYIKGFQNAHALSVSVGNSYSDDQLMHTFLDNFHQVGK